LEISQENKNWKVRTYAKDSGNGNLEGNQMEVCWKNINSIIYNEYDESLIVLDGTSEQKYRIRRISKEGHVSLLKGDILYFTSQLCMCNGTLLWFEQKERHGRFTLKNLALNSLYSQKEIVRSKFNFHYN